MTIKHRHESESEPSSSSSLSMLLATPAFYEACEQGNLEMLQYLIENNNNNRSNISSSNNKNDDDKNNKNNLIENDNIFVMDDHHPITMMSMHEKQSPLLIALKNRHFPIVRFLLEEQQQQQQQQQLAGMDDLNIVDDHGLTPLHYACKYGLLDIVQYLLTSGNNVNVNAIKHNHYHHHYYSHDYDHYYMDACYNHYFNHRHCADYSSHEKSQKKQRRQEQRIIGTTPLHYACGFDRDDDEKDDDDDTTTTANRNRLEIVKCLIAHGANVTIKDEINHFTPLNYVFLSGHLDIVQVLIEAGGPDIIRASGYDGNYFEQYPDDDPIWKESGYLSTLVTCCPIIIHTLSKRCIQRLVEENTSSSSSSFLLQYITSTRTGNLPLHDACMYGCTNKDVIEYMIQLYPKGLYQQNARGRLPFHEACGNGMEESSEIVSLLRRHHCSALVDRDAFGRLPIEIAIAFNAPVNVTFSLLNGLPSSLMEILVDGQ